MDIPHDPTKIHPASLPVLTGMFTNAIMMWNQAESSIKQIVQLLLGESTVSFAVAAEMKNLSLVRAVQVASKIDDLGDLSDHLRHYCIGFDILREYRNFYVHGIYATTVQDGTTALQMLTVDAPGKIRMSNPVITANDLQKYSQDVQNLIGYSVAIQIALGATGTGIDKMVAAYDAKLEKPIWPTKVNKMPQYLQSDVPESVLQDDDS